MAASLGLHLASLDRQVLLVDADLGAPNLHTLLGIRASHPDLGDFLTNAVPSNAGMEVIYTGRHQTPEQIVNAAIQEDVDAIGLSIHSGAHETLFGKVLDLLKERRATDVLIFGGGIISKEDADHLKALGVTEIFGPGSRTDEIVRRIEDELREKGKRKPN